MANLMSASKDRVVAMTPARHFERHRSATKLLTEIDPILKCVELEYLEELEEMLAMNSKRCSQHHLDEALHRAAELGKSHACVLLLNAGSDVDSLESTHKFEQRFENSGCSFSSEQAQRDIWMKTHSSLCGTALHLAVENGRVETVHVLIKNGACINMVDRNRVTPLMLACMRRGSQDIVRLLVSEKNCDIGTKEKLHGKTALHFAAENADPESLSILLKSGAEADVNDKMRNTPLILCCAPATCVNPKQPPREPTDCVQILCEHGAYVNNFNDYGQSALELAVLSRLHDTVKFLLQKGAILQRETLRTACLETRDPNLVQELLAEANSIQDEYLCAILLIIINTTTSKWSLNSRGQEENTHQLARTLIKSISDPDSYLAVSTMNNNEMIQEFGENFIASFPKSDRLELESYGFLGYSIVKGKYGIARMLYVAGCRDKLIRMSGNTKVVHLANSHPYLKQWLAFVLERAATTEAMAAATFFYDANELDSIEAYDENIHDSALHMIDQSYSRREDAKASSARTIILYNE